MKRIVRVVLAAVLAVSMFGLLAGCGKGAGDIERITVGEQESNGVDIKNYQVYLKDSVDWAALSDADREKIAKTAFSGAQDRIKEDAVFNYNIVGVTANGELAFQFDRENSVMVIFIDNAQVATVAVELPQS